MSNDLKFHGIEWLGSIKDMCLNNEDCKECPYSGKNYNCLIYEVTSTFPDNWVIDTIGKEGE